MVSRAINDKLDSRQLKELSFPSPKYPKIMTPLSNHLSNLLLIARETMRFLVRIY